MHDALRIYYLLLLESDAQEDVTAFQLFSRSWKRQLLALNRLPTLPRDVLEPSYAIDDVLIQRVGGMRQLSWLPLHVKFLDQLTTAELGVFVVCFTGEEGAASQFEIWRKKQEYQPLHVTTTSNPSAIGIDRFSFEALHKYCRENFQKYPQAFSDEQRSAAEASLENWKEPTKHPSELKRDSHNIFQPNYMSLDRAARSLDGGSHFVGGSEAEYTERILKSCKAVTDVRASIGVYPIHLLSHLRPGLVLAEPAMLRPSYARIKADGPLKEKTVATTLRMLQKQSGLFNQAEAGFLKDFQESKNAQAVMAERQSELHIFTLAAGVFASQTTSAVMRLSPGVNHVFPSLSIYARNVRSPKIEARLKTRRLFEAIQSDLAKAVGIERIEFIREHDGPVKIIADAPVEWLPIGNLPLGIKYDCSRINATPGNLLMAFLALGDSVRLHPDQLRKILVVNAFQDDDPLRDILTGALETLRPGWEGQVEIEFKKATSKETFIEALNSFDGHILIFDGHGIDNANEPVGKLALGPEEVDVWNLRGKVRIPAIVILSACDTHGIDASSQATVGNGFLAIGAHTVLATLLPVGGLESAGFIARLVYRISDFIPSAIRARGRVLNWAEVIGGMLRMLLATEILNALVGPPEEEGTLRFEMQTAANVDINTHETLDWFDNLVSAIATYKHEPIDQTASRARTVIARSEAIRYVQLGHPETILIDDGKVAERIDEAIKRLEELPSGNG